MRPAAVAHADWSAAARKRWVAVAKFQSDGSYVADGPFPVGRVGSLLERLALLDAPGPTLVGFDFPIGLPQAYVELAEIDDFRTALGRFGHDQWKDFFQVAVEAHDISVHRPFYPTSW